MSNSPPLNVAFVVLFVLAFPTFGATQEPTPKAPPDLVKKVVQRIAPQLEKLGLYPQTTGESGFFLDRFGASAYGEFTYKHPKKYLEMSFLMLKQVGQGANCQSVPDGEMKTLRSTQLIKIQLSRNRMKKVFQEYKKKASHNPERTNTNYRSRFKPGSNCVVVQDPLKYISRKEPKPKIIRASLEPCTSALSTGK